MNGIYYQDPLEKESYDEDDFYEEAVGTTAEFNPLGAVSSAIGGLLGGGGRRQPVRHRDHRPSPAPGVRDARLETPRGSANLRLPEEVVSKRVFDEATSNLEDGITKVTARVNSLEQKDLPELKKEMGALLVNTRQAIADEKKARQKAMTRQARALQSTQSTNLIMSLLFQQQLQRKLESHFHDPATGVPEGSGAEKAELSGGDNNALLLLPLMMMGQGGGMGGGGSYREGDNGSSYSAGGSADMMMPIMMLTLLK